MVLPAPGLPAAARARRDHRPRAGDLPVDPDARRAELDLDALDRLFADGARTLLLTQPHNPCGRVHTRAELEGLRDLVARHGARVISDEIHAPLVLPGAEHVPYLALEGTADHAVAVVGRVEGVQHRRPHVRPDRRRATGRRSSRLLERPDGRATTRGRRSGWSPPSRPTSTATTWLAALVDALDRAAHLLGDLLAEHLPRRGCAR